GGSRPAVGLAEAPTLGTKPEPNPFSSRVKAPPGRQVPAPGHAGGTAPVSSSPAPTGRQRAGAFRGMAPRWGGAEAGGSASPGVGPGRPMPPPWGFGHPA